MSYIDVAIPGMIGAMMLIWPRSVFVGSRVSPDENKLRWIRRLGIGLVSIAAGYLAIRLSSS